MAAKKSSKILSQDIRLVVVFSDLHSGSRRSLMPTEHPLYEDGKLASIVKANKQQLWLLDCWQQGWEKALDYIGGDPWAWAFLGDAVEGVHRKMTEIISVDVTDHMNIFHALVSPYAELATKRFFVRGTQVHTGDTIEMKLAEKLNCEPHPDTGQWAADRWLLNVNGHNLLLRHHVTTTSREYLRCSGINIELDNEILAAAKRGQPVPDSAVFAHRHMYDAINNGRNFAMVCGPWQQTTRYGHTKWSAMLPQPTITVLDWRDVPAGGPPVEKTFQFTPQAAKVFKL